MSISTQAEAIKIPQQQADLLSTLMRLPPGSPVEAVSRLVLKDNAFCDRLIDVVFPRRPPSITESTIHESIRDLGVDRVRLLFISHNVAQAFSTAKLKGFEEHEFWVHAIQRGAMSYCLAQELEYIDLFEAYVSGFLTGIGSLLLAARFPHMSEHLRDIRSRPLEVRANIERILLGTNHCEEVANSGLTHLIPPRIVQTLTGYLDPYPSTERKYLLTNLVAVGVNLADVTNTIPCTHSMALAERYNKSLPQSVNLSKMYTTAMELSHQLCKDLGYNVPPPRTLQDILDGKLPPPTEEDDPLANLFRFTMEKTVDTRNGFLEKLETALQDNNQRDDISIMLVDLDSFSKINDTYGCPTADSLLSHLGLEIARSMRPLDHVARIDADQFALLMPKTQAMGAKVVAERIRSLVKNSTIAMGTIRPNCTASVGGLTLSKDKVPPPTDKVWAKVLQLMQMAKDKGKNRIIWAS